MDNFNLLNPDPNDPEVKINLPEDEKPETVEVPEAAEEAEKPEMFGDDDPELQDISESATPEPEAEDLAAESTEYDGVVISGEDDIDELVLEELTEHIHETSEEEELILRRHAAHHNYEEAPAEQKKRPVSSILTYVLVVAMVAGAFIYMFKPELLSWAQKNEEMAVIVPADTVEEVIPEFKPISIDSSQAEEIMQKTKSEMIKEEGLLPETGERLIRFITLSGKRIAQSINVLQSIPKGVFISYFSSSGNIVLMEVKTDNAALFQTYHETALKKKIFTNLQFIQGHESALPGYKGYFVGTFNYGVVPGWEAFYNLTANDFVDYIAGLAADIKMNFTELTYYEIDNEMPKIKSTYFNIGFYGQPDQITSFLQKVEEIPGTFVVKKIFISRSPTDSYPIPMKLTLYITMFEREE